MDPSIIVAIITGFVTLVATVITVRAGISEAAKKAAVQQAITETKLDELAREVRRHNAFAERLPVVENDIRTLYKRIEKLEEDRQ